MGAENRYVSVNGAVETSLIRSAATRLVWAQMRNNMLHHLGSVDPDDLERQRLRACIQKHAISRRERRQVERNFDALVNYVFRRDECSQDLTFASCLKILHRYRNAAHHRDTVRSDVLGPAVSIYSIPVDTRACQLTPGRTGRSLGPAVARR